MNIESLISKEDYKFYEDKRIWSKLKNRFFKGYQWFFKSDWLKINGG